MTKTMEVTLPELLEGLNSSQIPSHAKVRITFDDREGFPMETRKDPTVALFKQWEREDAEMTPEQETENERIYAEIERKGIPRVQI